MSFSITFEKHPEAGVAKGELLLAAAVAALGLFLLLGISQIRFGAGYDRIGPRFFPSAVAAGLILLGGWVAVAAFRNRRRPQPLTQLSQPLNWVSFGYLGLALVLNLALLERAGFVIACSVQFWLAARAFHSHRPARDAVVAVLLSAIVYFAFSHLLGVTLPAGILESIS
ncbi:MAG: tripartite tricarboxylate transporter TctB family protein [Acidobacteria bacterium]|nr:tripartite tricarboxylate transporter TctB family protein [Acidobacteriota bacterium]